MNIGRIRHPSQRKKRIKVNFLMGSFCHARKQATAKTSAPSNIRGMPKPELMPQKWASLTVTAGGLPGESTDTHSPTPPLAFRPPANPAIKAIAKGEQARLIKRTESNENSHHTRRRPRDCEYRRGSRTIERHWLHADNYRNRKNQSMRRHRETLINHSRRNQRLSIIHDEINATLDAWNIEAIAIERVFHTHNVTSSLTTGAVIGILQFIAHQRGLPIHQFTPQQVKACSGLGAKIDKDTAK